MTGTAHKSATRTKPDEALALSGMHIDLSNLSELMSALVEHMMDLDHFRDGKLDGDMQRATAIATIARDITDRLTTEMEGLV